MYKEKINKVIAKFEKRNDGYIIKHKKYKDIYWSKSVPFVPEEDKYYAGYILIYDNISIFIPYKLKQIYRVFTNEEILTLKKEYGLRIYDKFIPSYVSKSVIKEERIDYKVKENKEKKIKSLNSNTINNNINRSKTIQKNQNITKTKVFKDNSTSNKDRNEIKKNLNNNINKSKKRNKKKDKTNNILLNSMDNNKKKKDVDIFNNNRINHNYSFVDETILEERFIKLKESDIIKVETFSELKKNIKCLSKKELMKMSIDVYRINNSIDKDKLKSIVNVEDGILSERVIVKKKWYMINYHGNIIVLFCKSGAKKNTLKDLFDENKDKIYFVEKEKIVEVLAKMW